VAQACGFKESRIVTRDAELTALHSVIHKWKGPNFAQVKVAAEKLPLVLPPHDGQLLKARFRRALLGDLADVPPEKL